MKKVYLTIDDSPSPHTKKVVDYLNERNIQALFFCIGEKLEQFPGNIDYAVQHGHVLANHSYTHRRFSLLSYEECVEEIEKTEGLIDQAYNRIGQKKPGKYFRFPHMDRGAGGWIVDYNQIADEYRETVISLFADGVNINPDPPTDDMIDKKNRLQEYLQTNGYQQPFQNITHPWFQGTELEHARDCMYTFSNSDWMLLDRHKGKWPFRSLDDLKMKIDRDQFLNNDDSHHIVLAHDKPEPELFPVFKALTDYMINNHFRFLGFD